MSNSSLGNNIGGGGYHTSGLNSGSLFDYGVHPNLSPPPNNHPSVQYSPHTNSNNYSSQQNQSSNGAFSESQLRGLIEEVAMSRNKLASWDERIAQARTACEAWQREAEESNRKANVAEKERDEAMQHFKVLQQEIEMLQGSPYLHCVRRTSELGSLSLQILKQLQEQLRNDCEKIEQVGLDFMSNKCRGFC
jgi:chromosome segregation ATPase